MLIKQKSLSLSKNLAMGTFGELLIVFSIKINYAIPPLFNSLQILPSTSDETNVFAKTFLRTLILMTQVSLYLLFLLELI